MKPQPKTTADMSDRKTPTARIAILIAGCMMIGFAAWCWITPNFAWHGDKAFWVFEGMLVLGGLSLFRQSFND